MDIQRKHVSGDIQPRECGSKNLLRKAQYSAPNVSTSRKVTGQHDVTNLRTSEPGVSHTDPSDKLLLGGPHSYPQDTMNFTTEQQLEHLVPSKELLLHYRQKITQLNNDYQDLMEKVDK
jgi:hypothetical protein